MPEELFDPYRQWLGLTTENRPPNHYELLGLEEFESDPEAISAAVQQRAAILQMVTGGEAGRAQQILAEIGQARSCLLDDERKRLYDQQLREQDQRRSTSPGIANPESDQAEPFSPSSVSVPDETPPGAGLDEPGANIAINAEDRATQMQSRIELQRAREVNDQRIKIIVDRVLWGSCAVCLVAIIWALTVRINGCNQQPMVIADKQDEEALPEVSSQKIPPRSQLPSVEPLVDRARPNRFRDSQRAGTSVNPGGSAPVKVADEIKETIAFFGFNERVRKNELLPGLAPLRLNQVTWSKHAGGGQITLGAKSQVTVESDKAFDTIRKLTLLCRFKSKKQDVRQVLFSLKGALVVALEKGQVQLEVVGQTVSAGSDLTDGNWHALAVSLGQTSRIWLDGQWVEQAEISLPRFSDFEELTEIGGRTADPGHRFIGQIDRIGFYWIELEPAQIEAELAR